MAVVDAAGRVVGANAAFGELTGRRVEAVLGRPWVEVAGGGAGEEERVWGRVIGGEVWRDEIEAVRVDGTRYGVERVLSPVRSHGGGVTHVMAVLRDITVRRQMEDERRRHGERVAKDLEVARAGLAGVTRDLEMFAYAVSHDLRAPLRAIDFFGRELVDHAGSGLDEEARSYLDRIFAARRRMVQIIDGMMALFHIGRGELRWVDLDVTAMAEEVLAELRRTQPGRTVVAQVQPGLRARGDSRLVQAVLGSLLDNAWKFTGRKADARIEVGAREGEDGRVFYVRDNGAGFNMAYADRLFTTIRRLHTQEEYEGCGIGLVSVHRALQRHQGRIWVEASEGQGATFFFTLGPGPAAGRAAASGTSGAS